MRYGIALDLGTSGFRTQAIDLDTKETVATAITERHPIPGMNVIDHVNFAIKSGEDVANGLMIGAINNLFKEFNIDMLDGTTFAQVTQKRPAIGTSFTHTVQLTEQQYWYIQFFSH